jgi:predicted TIM-barrel fold metal-dependent hydrolase
MDRLILVSGDSHACVPDNLWPDYIESTYHDLLPELREDNERYQAVGRLFAQYPEETLEVVDDQRAIRSGGITGLWDPDRRLQEMDREGISAEVIYGGDVRMISILSGPGNRKYPANLRAVGIRAYNRWMADFVKKGNGRFLPVADSLPTTDVSAMISELNWIADHGFVGTIVPGNIDDTSLPPLYDSFYDPFWSACVDLGLKIGIHAGYGLEQGVFLDDVYRIASKMNAATPQELLNELVNNTSESFFALDFRPRRAFWQLMVGGVFDRHPELKCMLTEIRADWIPPVLAYLDERFKTGETPLKLRPSEYFQRNCIAGVSSIHLSEVQMRYEIGVDQIMFGRDYPHPEGTWPNSWTWIRDALAGVSETECRKILGENAIAFLGLDRDALAAVSASIGPRPEDILGAHAESNPEVIQNFHDRGGYLRPAEQTDMEKVRSLFDEDLASVGVGS